MHNLFAFLIILGPLVIFHEFGHYIFARIFNVKAEIFSIGFGPRLWSKQIGETEWRISPIPLGGYVKLLGEDPEQALPPELQHRALQRQAPWKRFFIFFGGPLFNFILAVLIFMVIMLVGEEQLGSVVGRVLPGSTAEVAGFQSGDRIVSVNGKPVTRFDEVMSLVSESPNQPVSFVVNHVGTTTPTTITATPSIQDGFSIYGEKTEVGEVEGLIPFSRSMDLGISDPQSLAAKSGFKTGDKVASLNGAKPHDWEDLERLYGAVAAGSPVTLKIERGSELTFTKAAGQSLAAATGVHSTELFVDRTVDKSPATVAGILQGDRLVGIGSKDVRSFHELRDEVQKAGEKDGKILLRWERDGKSMSATVIPTATLERDPALKKTTQYTVGVMPKLAFAAPVAVVTERVLNPFKLVYKATERTVVFSWRNIVSIAKMVMGDVSVGTLGGPILIGKLAGESLSKGLVSFLSMMAILSVGLGVLNILPIPVLDGGHLLLLGLETVRGKPLSMRQMERVQQVGLVLILVLMGIVMKNDFTRLF